MKKYLVYTCLLVLLCIVSNTLLLSNSKSKLDYIKKNFYFEQKVVVLNVDSRDLVKDLNDYLNNNLNNYAILYSKPESNRLSIALKDIEWYLPLSTGLDQNDLNDESLIIPNSKYQYPPSMEYASFVPLKVDYNEKASGIYYLVTDENIDFLNTYPSGTIDVRDYNNSYQNKYFFNDLSFVVLLLFALKLMVEYLFEANQEYVVISKLLGYQSIKILGNFLIINLVATLLAYLISLYFIYKINLELFQIDYIKGIVWQANIIFIGVIIIYYFLINLLYYHKVETLSVVNLLREELD